MKFLICPASPDQIDNNEYTLFKGDEFNSYNYEVEFFEDDMVKIMDSVGRYVPLEVEEIPELITILKRIDKYQKGKMKARIALTNELLSGLSNIE